MKNKEVKKNILSEQVKTYSALAVGLLAIGSNTNGQILYTDEEPDAVIKNTEYKIDLNKDGKVDFKLIHMSYSYQGSGFSRQITIEPKDTANRILFTDDMYPAVMNFNSAIGQNGNWDNDGDELAAYSSTYGDIQKRGKWTGVNDKYLGLSITIDGKRHYGWIRLDVDKDIKSFTVKDFALNLSPNENIAAGEGAITAINPADLLKELIMYSANGNLHIQLPDIKDKVSIDLFEISGKLLQSKEIGFNTNNTEINNLKSGMYIVVFRTKDGIFSKKIFIS